MILKTNTFDQAKIAYLKELRRIDRRIDFLENCLSDALAVVNLPETSQAMLDEVNADRKHMRAEYKSLRRLRFRLRVILDELEEHLVKYIVNERDTA